MLQLGLSAADLLAQLYLILVLLALCIGVYIIYRGLAHLIIYLIIYRNLKGGVLMSSKAIYCPWPRSICYQRSCPKNIPNLPEANNCIEQAPYGRDYSLGELARAFGVTRGRIQQLEKRARRHLEAKPEIERLREYVLNAGSPELINRGRLTSLLRIKGLSR